MKKVNKILMAVIAILLSLVLISTSVVSGIFAKFVIEKTAEVDVDFKAFGVKLSVGREAQVISGPDAKSVSIMYDDFEMYPGVDKTPAIWFLFDNGKLLVDAKLTIKVYVELSDKFLIPADDKDGNDIPDFSGLTGPKYKTGQTYMPLDFKIVEIDTNGSLFGTPYHYSASMSSKSSIDELETTLENGIADKIKSATYGGTKDSGSDTKGTYCYVTKDFEKDERIKIDNTRGLGIGFKWEEGIEYDSTKTDKIAQNALSTWIANQFTDPNEKPIKITLTISLEQTA